MFLETSEVMLEVLLCLIPMLPILSFNSFLLISPWCLFLLPGFSDAPFWLLTWPFVTKYDLAFYDFGLEDTWLNDLFNRGLLTTEYSSSPSSILASSSSPWPAKFTSSSWNCSKFCLDGSWVYFTWLTTKLCCGFCGAGNCCNMLCFGFLRS